MPRPAEEEINRVTNVGLQKSATPNLRGYV